MAVANDYVTGTITLTNGSTAFTGTGTAWRLANFRDGDRIYVDNLVAIIAPNSINDPFIDSNTSGKLTQPWTGTTGTRSYRMSYKPDGARVTAETRNLIELLGNGNLEAIAALTPTVNALIRGNAGGTAWETFTPTAAAFSLLALAVAANKSVYFTDASTAATFDLTAAGRALLDDASADAQLTTLGVSAFIKTLLPAANAGAAQTTLGISTFIKALLDDTDGSMALASLGVTKNLVSNGGWYRFPGGIMLQWGSTFNAATDFATAFPTAFPTACFGVFQNPNFNTAATNAYIINTSNVSVSTFDTRVRVVSNGGLVAAQANLPFFWLAGGY